MRVMQRGMHLRQQAGETTDTTGRRDVHEKL